VFTYTPIRFNNDDGEAVYRTYMYVNNGEYHIYVTSNLKRVFTDETLPDAIKVAVGIINAYNWDDLNKYSETLLKSNVVWKFEETYPEILIDIGWRNGNDYCLVLYANQLQDLRTSAIRQQSKHERLTLSEGTA
jgi:hypothetical protein